MKISTPKRNHSADKRRPFYVWALLLIGVLCFVVSPLAAQPTPIGPASWLKADGRIQRAVGPGRSTPTLNYQKDDGSWDYIVDDWVQVGDAQVWESVRGNHRVYADSTGAAIYAKGNHYLGTKTTHLIKFKKSDSTWTTLQTVNPDSVTTSGRTITFWGIAPGANKTLTNNAKVFQNYTEQFEFTQVARDWLATKGPWANRLFGTATKLTVDSLNLSLKDAAGVFGINATGRMVDGWVSLGSADTTAFYIATSYLETEDSTVQSIPVRKWIVFKNGSPWMIELFDPVAASALPPGTIRHNATFGRQTTEGSTTSLSARLVGGRATCPTAGTGDSITAYLPMTGIANVRCGLYKHADVDTLLFVDSTQIREIPNTTAWQSFALQNGVSIDASQEYVFMAWGQNSNANIQRESTPGITRYYRKGLSFGNIWPTEINAPEIFEFTVSIYVTYTETAAGDGNIIPLLDTRPIRGVGRGIGYYDEDIENPVSADRGAGSFPVRLCD